MAVVSAKVTMTKAEVKVALETYLRSSLGMNVTVYDFSLDTSSLSMELNARLERVPTYSER